MIYATVDSAGKCFGIIETSAALPADKNVVIPSYSTEYIGKTWDGSTWVGAGTEATVPEPTTEEINLALLLDLYAKLEEKGVI